MTILALEFSSPQRSVAVTQDETVLCEIVETGERGVAAFAMIEKALAGAKRERDAIDTLVVGLGPGSYTGIRAAIALARGWQLARSVTALGVSSATAVAVQAQKENLFGRVHIAINAQREEFYFTTCEINETACLEVEPLKIVPVMEVRSRAQSREIIIGPETFQLFAGRPVFPRASALAGLAARQTDLGTLRELVPIYLRETNFVKAVR